ncbi:MAG: NAD(P)H-dependent oxidoreductase [Spirochaetaceae bacterium]|nr:NAD(P)H-dependent oxidoreductase [Spirochaetaceae bacterium]
MLFIHIRRFITTIISTLLLLSVPGFIDAAGISESVSDNRNMENRLVVTIDSISGASLYPGEQLTGTNPFMPGDVLKALIIHADPKSDNLTAAVRDRMVDILISQGWEVEVRSLYEDSFNPVASADEVSFQKSEGNSIDPQVAEYQSLITQADALVLVYPLWWNQPPAILKGWQDRVFSYGFAYEFVNNSPDSVISLLAGRKVFIINSAASSKDVYEDHDYLHYLDLADASLYGVSGIELAGRHIIYSSTLMGMDDKKACLEELSNLVSLIEPSY